MADDAGPQNGLLVCSQREWQALSDLMFQKRKGSTPFFLSCQ